MGAKTYMVRHVVFLGLDGPFSVPDADMRHSLNLPDAKNDIWPARIEEFLKSGPIAQKELEYLTGSHPSSRTSIFGRFGGETIQPLYRKKNTNFTNVNCARFIFQRCNGWRGTPGYTAANNP